MKRLIPLVLLFFLCSAFFGTPKIETTTDKDFRNSVIEMLDSLKADNRQKLAKAFSLILTNGKSATDIPVTKIQDIYAICEQNAQWGNKTHLNNLKSLDNFSFDDLQNRATQVKKIYQDNKAKKEAEWQGHRIDQLQHKLVKTKSSITEIQNQDSKKANFTRTLDYLTKRQQWLEKTIRLIEGGEIKNKNDESDKMGFEPSYITSNNF